MKKSLLGLFFIIALAISSIAQETGIKFQHDSWNKIVQKAKAENKLIFMDAYTTWCGPCKMLQNRIFPNKELGDFYNKNFINAKIDMESGEGPALSAKYNVQAYPTMFYIDPNNGKVIAMVMGYQEIATLMDIGKKVVAKKPKKS